ncbi:MAG TPA: ribosome maturation factor RimM [Paludibacteraceae bacterium]|mgnify:CR=1 FL=1|nr:ribosome maturation factor RimM [Paludibacteraceae bacterium]HQB68581.1 ribosome maturation factor RimM [Paludibacteraceae bacterium]HRS67084.1 ribosome maturation factor RimM [Paludibacteraceae bacterium]
MIQRSELVLVGKTGKTHGIKGELIFEFSEDFNIEVCEYFVLEIEAIFVPFFIYSYRFKSDTTALILLEGITDEPRARELSGKLVYVKREMLVQAAENLTLSYFLGFRVHEESHGVLGVIDELDESTANVLFVVGERLIPASDAYITEIDHDKRILYVSLPEGLLDL